MFIYEFQRNGELNWHIKLINIYSWLQSFRFSLISFKLFSFFLISSASSLSYDSYSSIMFYLLLLYTTRAVCGLFKSKLTATSVDLLYNNSYLCVKSFRAFCFIFKIHTFNFSFSFCNSTSLLCFSSFSSLDFILLFSYFFFFVLLLIVYTYWHSLLAIDYSLVVYLHHSISLVAFFLLWSHSTFFYSFYF